MDKKKSKKGLVVLLLILAILIAVVPFLMLKDAEFGGSDDAAGGAIEEIHGCEYEPWITPILESYLGGEIPGEIESLIFCVQTGIGVGILAFFMGRFYERKKWMKDE